MTAVNGKAECLHELFEAQVDIRPLDLALICGDVSLTYRELEQRANQLARHIRSYGAGPGALVGLYFERSELPIIAVLACLKAGVAYIPLDPDYPQDRVRHILADAEAVLLLSEQSLFENAAVAFHGNIVLVDSNAAEIAEQSTARLSRQETGVSSLDLCYVIYTSGTTGRPKGVMTEHGNAVSFVLAFNDVCQMNHTDRIYQGFSLAFDGSVEEIWMAYSNGATLVVGTRDVVRFGSEVARLLTKHNVTYLSTVPTFLSMIDEDLPTVRLLVVSAEPCPPELVAKWATPNRRMLNVYGPTEATVNTTAAECEPGKPVTIGRALPEYETYVLDDQLHPVAPGEHGELFIGGVCIARGYLKQPELTAKQFVANTFKNTGTSPRLYRTGDLVRENHNGDLEFMGRIDSQVKVRGFRVELSEIEAVLLEHPEIRAAAVKVVDRDGAQDLAGYVVPNDPNTSFEGDEVYELLQARLPAYMVPAYLDSISKLPSLTSGKIDRKSLPDPITPLVRKCRKIVEPATDLERDIADVWKEIFKVSPISVEDDFFLDLGGYSLLAAQVVSRLRSKFALEVAIRDIYGHSTIRKLAEKIDSIDDNQATESAPTHNPCAKKTSREVFHSLSFVTRWSCVGLQFLSLFLFYGFAALPLVILSGIVFSTISGTLAIEPAIFIFAAITLGGFPALLITSILLKWVIIGRYKAGRYPLWGWYYFRWWLASRIQTLSGIGILSGTPVMILYYRLMGAKVGRNCIIDTATCSVFDLITIGDDTSICAETQLTGYRIEDGMLILGTIEIGSRCFVGIHSNLGLNTRMGDDSKLDDLSLLPDGAVMEAGQARRGSPAQAAEVALPDISDEQASRRHPFLFGLIHLLLAGLLGIVMFVTAIPSIIIVLFPLMVGGTLWAMSSLLIAIPVQLVWFCLSVAALKALILGRIKPGVYKTESLLFLRKWMVDAMMGISRGLLHPLYSTIYLPTWLRLMGAKIGLRAEISTVTQVTPDLIVIEDESFFADGSMIGGRHFFRGHVELATNRIGKRSFVGNNAVLPIGKELGDNCLLGVISSPPADGKRTPDGTEWLGSPSFRLPHRVKVEGFKEYETYRPTVRLYILRFIIDALRILIPYYILAAGFIAFASFLSISYAYLPLWVAMVFTPPVAFALAVGVSLCVVVLKRMIMAPFKPVIKPLWSTYVWWNEVINGAYETVAAPALAPLMGTPFLSWYLRLMGCKVGKHVFLETALFSEFDLVDIGDYAALNLGVVVQNHLFEDRIMKSSYLRIGDECSVGNMSVVLYDTEMEAGATIGPLSLLMKGETLPQSSRWLGIPTSPDTASG
ncbi:MAG: amino acid adenylation domain-containing protein [Pirellulales bacterium]|nr:amino acid adenylation domain-containing protein [Pirellulales bacterium]